MLFPNLVLPKDINCGERAVTGRNNSNSVHKGGFKHARWKACMHSVCAILVRSLALKLYTRFNSQIYRAFSMSLLTQFPNTQ
jgi:hypothetical protein